mmetsp:Transcript_26559/g.74301  ORF Transcript_26559/g.74301 Transcript_26559/m.74301 type:complete len:539 (-) Transcript_26559:107-1723(-)
MTRLPTRPTAGFVLAWFLANPFSQLDIVAAEKCADGASSSASSGLPCCNGFTNLCTVPVNEMMYGMIHNAMSSVDTGFVFFANHFNDAFTESLDVGYRGLSIDLCNCDNGFQLCHGSEAVNCGVGRRDPVEVMRLVNTWLIDHPRELLVLNWELNEDAGGDIELQDLEQIVTDVGNGFAERLYHHPETVPTTPWPKLGDLLDAGSQVILFYHRGPTGGGLHPDGIHYLYDYTKETEFSYASVAEITDTIVNQNCPIDRGASSSGDWLYINNFVTENVIFAGQVAPSQDAAEEINTVAFGTALVEACQRRHDKMANFISVDFWKTGNLITLVDSYNANLVGDEDPIATAVPTMVPTAVPTTTPTAQPTTAPTSQPTRIPTGVPTQMPTVPAATSQPTTPVVITQPPTQSPTQIPTNVPTMQPTMMPSTAPTSQPTDQPTFGPTSFPTMSPTRSPTSEPTISPTSAPTSMPSAPPTSLPSSSPTDIPTMLRTSLPTILPPTSDTNNANAAAPSGATPSLLIRNANGWIAIGMALLCLFAN